MNKLLEQFYGDYIKQFLVALLESDYPFLSIDPSVTSTGVSYIDKEDITLFNIKSTAGIDDFNRVNAIANQMADILAKTKPEFVVMESPLYKLNRSPSIYGVSLFFAREFLSRNLPILFIHPNRLHSFVAHYLGLPSKYEKQIFDFLSSYFPNIHLVPIDCVDALLLGLMISKKLQKKILSQPLSTEKILKFLEPYNRYVVLPLSNLLRVKERTLKVSHYDLSVYKIDYSDLKKSSLQVNS